MAVLVSTSPTKRLPVIGNARILKHIKDYRGTELLLLRYFQTRHPNWTMRSALHNEFRSFSKQCLTALALWPLMIIVPLVLSYEVSPWSYCKVFPQSWYADKTSTTDSAPSTAKALGLVLGISAVAVGQLFVILFFYLYSNNIMQIANAVQVKGAPKYVFYEGLKTHLSQPEGFALLVTYLTATWMFRLMPSSYYSFHGHIQWSKLILCLICQDGVQYLMHLAEHRISPQFYISSHKPHHRFTNPKLFDAFNGSTADTVCMILIPLYITANLVHCNVWTYMAFGSTYANWLTLIHSEYHLPWDPWFQIFGLGTPADHHVHHKLFDYNYGHLFMWWDIALGTYRNPNQCPRYFTVASTHIKANTMTVRKP